MSPTRLIPSALLDLDLKVTDPQELARFTVYPLRVMLSGWDTDLAQLAAIFDVHQDWGARLSKIDGSDKWALDVVKIPDGDPVRASDTWIAAINGAMTIMNELNAEIQFAGYQHWTGGDHVKARLPADKSVVVACPYENDSHHGEGRLRPELEEAGVLIRLSGYLPKVSGLMDLIAYDFDTWVGLYRVYEYVAGHVEGFSSQPWVNVQALERFKQTANSFPHLGREARHGNHKIPPPKNPMTKQEARSFVDRLCRHAVMAWQDEFNRQGEEASYESIT